MKISKTIYLNPYIAKFIIPPYNKLKYVQQTNTDNLQRSSLNLEKYFLYIPDLNVYTNCYILNEIGN